MTDTFTCEACGTETSRNTSRVNDSRPMEIMGIETIRRRRRCLSCDNRFTTYEVRDIDLMRLQQAGISSRTASIILRKALEKAIADLTEQMEKANANTPRNIEDADRLEPTHRNVRFQSRRSGP